MRFWFSLAFFILFLNAFSQESILQAPVKTLEARKRLEKISIDGKLSELEWKLAASATDFTTINPVPFFPSSQKTEVKVLFDDDALIFGAQLFDSSPDSIMTQMSQRDNTGNSDWFAIILDTYKDGNNAFYFGLTVNNVQIDSRMSANGFDESWDAVWESKTSRNEQGWALEIRIPYSAIRFAEAEEDVWNINFAREIRRIREEVWWNPLDPSMIRYGNPSGILARSGKLTGLKNLHPPLRLMLYPYLSNVTQREQGLSSNNTQFGADLKWGLNEAFTLDATTIPDFRQVRFDNQVLNLTPFEVKFNEFRQFFTEGIELFSKGDLFYSRRIGDRPYYSLGASKGVREVLVSSAGPSQLLNATKISGRTSGGLGIGVLNAVTAAGFNTYLDTVTQQTRTALVNPLTNSNLLVFDQNLANNSFFSVVSSNVLREGSAMDAQVLATQFRFNNKKLNHYFSGRLGSSWQWYSNRTNQGIKANWSVGKNAGKIQWSYNGFFMDNTYNQNDLGFQTNNNIFNQSASVSHFYFKPVKLFPWFQFNRFNHSISMNYNRVVVPSTFANASINYNFTGFTKKFMAMGFNLSAAPFEGADYFEPRTPGRFVYTPRNYYSSGWISSNYNKKVAIDAGWEYTRYDQKDRSDFTGWTELRFRIGDKTFIIPGLTYSMLSNNIGFVYRNGNDITLGRRGMETYETGLTVSHSFNAVLFTNFRMRNYWSTATYHSFFDIDENGQWGPTNYAGFPIAGAPSINDISFTAFTIDWELRWRFAPGSDLLVVYKNSLFNIDTQKEKTYWENVANVMGIPHAHSLSIKFQYFIDYQSAKNIFREVKF